jgi:hypothetical protein
MSEITPARYFFKMILERGEDVRRYIHQRGTQELRRYISDASISQFRRQATCGQSTKISNE